MILKDLGSEKKIYTKNHFWNIERSGKGECDKKMDEIQYPPTNHTETDDDSLELIVSIVVPILFSLIGIIGFIGNILVIITVVCNQQMRNTTNLLILNLSLADLLFVCFCIPATVSIY